MSESKSLYDNSIIITPRENFPYFYEFRNKFPELDFKVISLEDVEKMFSYTYDDRSLIYLLKKGLNYDKASKTLKALSRMKLGKSYKDSYLQQIYPYFLDLLEKGYLYNNMVPEAYFKNRKILISGYGSGTYLSSLIKDLPNIALSYDLESEAKLPKVFAFDDFHDELHYICLDIISLLEKGVHPSSIFLCGVQEAFLPEIEFYSKIYNLPLVVASSLSLSRVNFVKDVLARLGQEEKITIETLDDTKESLSSYSSDPNYEEFLECMYSLFDEELGKHAYLNALKARLEEKKKQTPKYNDCINLTSSYFFKKDSYAYHLCFSSKNAYSVPKEDGLISDLAKKELGMPTSLEEGKQNKQNLVNLLRHSPNLTLCLPSFYMDNAYYPSPLEGELGLEEISNIELPNAEYSPYYAKFELSFLKEKRDKFAISSPYITSLEKIAGDNHLFNHRYKKFDMDRYDRPYSYTSLSSYASCPFKFYCTYILGINEFEDTSSSLYGNLAHNILSKMYQKDFDFDTSFKEELEKEIKEDTPYSTRLYLKLAYPYIKNTYESIKEYEDSLVSPFAKTEFDLKSKFGSSYIKGRIDKAIIINRANSYLLLDYKTGSSRFSLEKVKYGLSLQLPIYYLLTKNSAEFQDKNLLGLFIAPIGVNYTDKENKEVRLFSLDGIFTSNEYQWAGNLDFISGVKEKTDGTLFSTSLSRFIVDENLANLEEETYTVLNTIINNIDSLEFNIAPVKYKREKLPCSNCSFSDICFHKKEDSVVIDPDEENTDEGDEE